MINKTHKILFRLCSLLFVLLITACTDGERGFVPLPVEPEEEKPADILISGAGVKGPLINAEVRIYKFELDKGEIHLFNAALKKWHELLAVNEVTVGTDGISTGSLSPAAVLDNLTQSFKQFGFTGQLVKLRSDIEGATSFTEADDYVSDYLVDLEGLVDLENIESNTKIRERVAELKSEAATLADYKSGIKKIKSLTDELEETETFSAARALLASYKNSERDETKIAGFDQAIAALDNYRSKANAFGISAIRTAYENEVYSVFISNFDVQNNPYSRQNLIDLKEALSAATSADEAETELQKAFDKESNSQLKSAISQLMSRISTLDDLKLDILGRETIYHNYGIREIVLSDPAPTNLSDLYAAVSELFSDNLEPSLRSSFIVENEEGTEENLLSFGETNEQGFLPRLQILQYRGFVYMEVNSISQTVDLNSGRKPILSKLETIFHTDDIIGNGAGNSEDKTVYYILNGVEQRDSEGKFITDRTLIESTQDDELLEIRPFITATPFTMLGLDVAIEKLKTLSPFRSDANHDGLPEQMLSKQLLTNSLTGASDLIVEALGIGMDTQNNIFQTPAVRLPQMKYSKESELAAIQHRFSLENFSAFVLDISKKINLSGNDVLDLIAEDLVDDQLDAKAENAEIPGLASIAEYTFLLQSDPSEKFLPDTNRPVSDIFYVMNDELSITQPDHSLSGFSVKRNDLTSEAPKGGRDSDGDSVLDNEDQFPNDPSQSRNLSPGYPGIWSVSFDASEYGYMPFEEDFVFVLNKQQVEGECTNAPCIGVGDLSVNLTAQYDVISAPAKHDLRLTAFNEADSIGFNAFATVPGNYLIRATFSKTAGQVNQESEQTYVIIVPIQVVDPKSIELKFDPEIPEAGKATRVYFKATNALCSLYSFCDEQGLDLTDNVPDYLDISLLADIYSVEQTLSRNGVSFNYSSVEAGGSSNTNISNIEVNDTLKVTVKFNAGVRSFIAKTNAENSGGSDDADGDGAPDTVDAFPNDPNCSLEKDGILDSNLDGAVNNLDEPTCFESFYLETDNEPLEVNFLNETWHYNENWDYIIRKNKYQTGFNGLILLPTLDGTKQFVEHFKVDEINKRVYFGYKNAAIDYFQLESQEIISFDSGIQYANLNSLNLVGGYVLAEYDVGSQVFEAKLFNKSGELAEINASENYPKPLNAIQLEIDGLNFLSATNNLFDIDWRIERIDPENGLTTISPQLSNDRVTLLEGQTVYSDVVKVQLSYTTHDDRQIPIYQDLFVLNLDGIQFQNEEFNPGQSVGIELLNFDASVLTGRNNLFVNWYINDEAIDTYRFLFSDRTYPFVLDGAELKYGDMIRAEFMLQHGEVSKLIKPLEATVLGSLGQIRPALKESETLIDIANLNVHFELADLTTNNQFYTTETFSPVWRINGIEIQGENGFTFPQLESTRFRYGDTISVSYFININGTTDQSETVEVATLLLDVNESKFNLMPVVAEVGEDISLDASIFTDAVLGTVEAFWRINSVVDPEIKSFVYPAERLSYGDSVELLIVPPGGELPSAYKHIAKASVGLNLFSLNQSSADPERDLDSDSDGIPNRQDYFRNDAYCSVSVDGHFDDIDGDGLSDLDEIKIHGTDPNAADTDNDGINDGDEITVSMTNPLIADTDSDGYKDGTEINLGADPLDANSPNTGLPDNDFDGLPNEEELLNKTLVNVADTDSDGLSDWYELKVENETYENFSDPLLADSDGDGLADGLEVRITGTDALNADTDGDGLSDGLEILLGLNPLLPDSDNNGVDDASEPGFDFSLVLTDTLYISDLPNYQIIPDHRIRVEAGSCYNSFISQHEPEFIAYSNEPQQSSLSQQQVAFASTQWAQVLRYDAANKAFLSPIDLSNYSETQLTSIEYDINNLDEIYLGFSDGAIRKFDGNTNEISAQFTADEGYAVTQILDQGAFILAEQITEDGQIIHSAFEKALQPQQTAFAKWSSDYSYRQSAWLDNNRTTLLVVDPQYNQTVFVREVFNVNSVEPRSLVDLVSAPSALNGPLFVETVDGNTLLRFGSGHSYNLTSANWLENRLAPFSAGFSHQAHRVVALKNSSLLQMTTLSTLNDEQYWRFTTQLEHSELIAVVPVGMHLLAITAEPASTNAPPAIRFQTILLGDEDANSLPDWWQRLSSGLTPADFAAYRLSDNANVPDYPNGDPDIDVTVQPPLLVDSDNDGICDQWELNMFGTNPLRGDTDSDGASDAQELGIKFIIPLDCSKKPEYNSAAVFVSDPLNPDTDNDGLADGVEHFQTFTNPLLVDTDGDELTDYQEVHITNTNPLVPNSLATDSDGDGLSDVDELNKYNTNHLSAHSDTDGLSDYDEVILHGTNPNANDTDGDGINDDQELDPASHLDPLSDWNNDGIIDSDDAGKLASDIDKYKSNPSKRDTDGDGLSDYFELNLSGENAFITYPTVIDSDSDSLTDKEELDFAFQYSETAEGIPDDVLLTLNPVEKDTDRDGICDVWEVSLFKTNPAEADTDFDGLLDAEELGIIEVGGDIQALTVDCSTVPVIAPISDPLLRDTDDDGVRDGDEIYQLNTDPRDVDSDDNGISDGNEDFDADGLTNSQELYILFSLPNNPDSNGNGISDALDDHDEDGLTNIAEINTYKTNPLKKDTNGDGIPDNVAIEEGLDPLSDDSDGDGVSDFTERADGTDPLKTDSDSDGLDDLEEKGKRTLPLDPDTDRDQLLDGADDLPLIFDADGDGIPDGIEVNILGTDPRDLDSDNDGILDGDEAWVFAFEVIPGATPTDPNVLTDNFLQVGVETNRVDLNSRKDQANWPKHNSPDPITFEDNGLDRRVYDLYDLSDNTRVIGKLFVRMFSNPARLDTDGDGLSDASEIAIEKTSSGSGFDLEQPRTAKYSVLKTNAENFKLSDPWVVDTDMNGVEDGLEDIDGDFLTNVLDQNNQATGLLIPDSDGDGIPDGVEVLVLNTNPIDVDTDNDGISDRNELHQFSIDDVREIGSDEVCLDSETRLTAIAGKDYCVLIEFISYPTLADSDNDGVQDSLVNPDNTVTLDYYPLDATCSAASDGFENTALGREQCFSSWMSESSDISMVQASEWQTSGGQERADILFYNQGWDKLIRFNTLTSRYLAPVAVNKDETIVGLATVAQSRSLFIFYSDGRLDRYDLETGITQTVDTLSQPGLTADLMLALGNGDLLVQYKDASNLSALYLYDQNGINLDSLSSLNIDIREHAFLCDNTDCNASGYIYAFDKNSNGDNVNVARIEVNLSARMFNTNISFANTLDQFAKLSGPIRLSQNKDMVYLASGQKLNLDLQDSDHSESLNIAHQGQNYTDFYDFLESNDHIIGIVDYDISGVPDAPLEPASRNGLIAEDTKYPNTYLVPPVTLEERILNLLSYKNTSTLDVAVVSKLKNSILIEEFGVIDGDGDGMTGIYENYYGLNDEDPSDRFKDPDTDGLTNIEEYYRGTDPLGDRFSDPDKDGLSNIDEYINGTDPLNPDTDEDGYNDLEELLADTDPNDASSFPSE